MEEFVKAMKDVITDVEVNSAVTPVTDNYNKGIHWKKMGLACDIVSKECTKLAVAFLQPPAPTGEEVQLMINDVLKAIDILASWFKTFPLSEGKVIHAELRDCFTRITQSVSDFMQNVNETNGIPGKKLDNTSIGTVWENCKRFHILPQDNLSAAKNSMNTSTKLITDALEELKNDIQDYDSRKSENNSFHEGSCDVRNLKKHHDEEQDEEEWSLTDLQLLKPCCSLILASRGLVKKSKAALDNLSTTENDIIDQLIEFIDKLSPSVDDLVMSSYPPINRIQLSEKVIVLKNIIEQTLQFLRTSSYGTEENVKWIDFIQKGVDHNFSSLNQLLTTI